MSIQVLLYILFYKSNVKRKIPINTYQMNKQQKVMSTIALIKMKEKNALKFTFFFDNKGFCGLLLPSSGLTHLAATHKNVSSS